MNGEENSAIAVLTNSDHGLEFAKEIARDVMKVDAAWEIKR